jgi:leader peptidase (prepilin peptidase)/N-methyltransferase
VEAIVASMLPLSGAAVLGPWPLVLAAFAIGACVGSFLNVCIHRLPAEQSVVAPRSRCPHCHTPIAWYDNVPVLSWLWLAARCRACGASIAARYPIVEAATGLLGILALAAFGPTPQAVLVFAFTAALLLVSVIDLDHRFIPDEVSKPGIAIGILASMLPGGIGLFDALAGACLGGGILWAVAWSYERSTGVEGMGFGDVKLLAMIGAFEGWTAIPAVLVIASLSGSLVGVGLIVLRLVSREGRRVGRRFGAPALLTFARRALRRTAIPFGPFLALGGMLVLYLPDFVGFSFFRF